MNTKIIVALVVGIALVGLTGAASAAYYELNSDYMYVDGAVNPGPNGWFDAYTDLYTEVTGFNPSGEATHMHAYVDNYMSVYSESSPATNVDFELTQAGATSMVIATELPGNLNTFASTDTAYQNIDYVADGDAFYLDFWGDSYTHASTHHGILPGAIGVRDYNEAWNEAWVSVTDDEEENPTASIKYGSTGYSCTTHAEATMEAEHMLGPVIAGSGIVVWGEAHGEIWEPDGSISNDIWGYQDVEVYWGPEQWP